MHNKFVIIDDNVLLLGSYNFQEGATLRNQENFCLLRDEKLIEAFMQQYDLIKQESCIYELKEEPDIQTSQEQPSSKWYKHYWKPFRRTFLICSLLLNVVFLILFIKR